MVFAKKFLRLKGGLKALRNYKGIIAKGKNYKNRGRDIEEGTVLTTCPNFCERYTNSDWIIHTDQFWFIGKFRVKCRK